MTEGFPLQEGFRPRREIRSTKSEMLRGAKPLSLSLGIEIAVEGFKALYLAK